MHLLDDGARGWGKRVVAAPALRANLVTRMNEGQSASEYCCSIAASGSIGEGLGARCSLQWDDVQLRKEG